MQKLIFLFALLFGSVAANAQTAQKSTAGENAQAYKAYIRADKEMNRVYHRQLKITEQYYTAYNEEKNTTYSSAKAALIASQKAFVAYRKKEGKYIEALHKGGAATPYYMYNQMKKLTEERIRQLQLKDDQ